MRTAEEIRAYLIDQLNSMYKRPGMYGGWLAATTVAWTLGHVDGYDEAIRVHDNNSRSPQDFVNEWLPDPDRDIYHSLFLPEFHRRGWFKADRLLSANEHRSLISALPLWAGTERTATEVVDSFGKPSWARGGWRGSPQIMIYAATDPTQPMVYLIAESEFGLVATWIAEGWFPAGLHITPRGKEFVASRQAE